VTFNCIAVFSIRRSRFPAVGEAAFEQFIGCRVLVPDGDRRHGSESGSVVNEKAIAIRNDHVVREFVLHDRSNSPAACTPRTGLTNADRSPITSLTQTTFFMTLEL
jgi:hypothetical protein